MNESQTIRIIIAAIFMIVAAFFMGYFLGNTAENTIRKDFSEPVTAIINGEEMPVVSAEITPSFTTITTDGGEKVTANNKSVIIYETEKYYEEK